MKILCIDQGIFVELCNRLADGGKNEVRYYCNWQKSQPQFSEYAPGTGFEYLKKEKYFWDSVDWADLIVNFDVLDADIITYLRKIHPNKSIFGSGQGERLEHDRWKLKKLIASMGLPLQKTYHIIGVSKLREFLKTHNDVYIKINIFRQDIESFYAKDFIAIEQRLHSIDMCFGPLADTIEFVAEECIKTDVEVGVDTFFNGNDYTDKSFMAYEYHKSYYIGKVIQTRDLPEPLKETMKAFRPILQKMDYRGALSTEEKIVSLKQHYFLDICSRMQSPASAGYVEWIKNFTEVIYKIGRKEKVNLDIPYKYVGAVFLDSKRGRTEYVHIDVKKEDRDKIKFFSACQVQDKYYGVKGSETLAVVIAQGNSVDEVLKGLQKNAELVNADDLNKDIMQQIDGIKKVIADGQKIGIQF